MNSSFMPLTLERTWVGTQRTGDRVGHITLLDLVPKKKKIYLFVGKGSQIRQCFSPYPNYYTESIKPKEIWL